MKSCPKCGNEHNKAGTYCSRSCANSRKWSPEINAGRSAKMIGRNSGKGPTNIDKWRASVQKTWLEKYNSTLFDDLGFENKRRRVFEEQNYRCNKCGISEWQGVTIILELDHKDGNNQNNVRENLEGLCPNCHSITDTWRGRNKPSKNRAQQVSDEFLLTCLKETTSIRQGLLKAGLAAKGNNYERAKKLLGL